MSAKKKRSPPYDLAAAHAKAAERIPFGWERLPYGLIVPPHAMRWGARESEWLDIYPGGYEYKPGHMSFVIVRSVPEDVVNTARAIAHRLSR